MKRFALGIAALAIAAAPLSSFAHEEEVAVGDYYVDVETTGVWQESNSDSGLQTQPHTHEDGSVTPADTRIA